jgi:hypothetical protein
MWRGRLSLSPKPAAIPAAATIDGSAAIPAAATIDRATTVPITAAIDGSTTIPIPAAIDCATTIAITAPVVGPAIPITAAIVGSAITVAIVGTGRIVDAGTVVSIAIGGVPITVSRTGAGGDRCSCRQTDDASGQSGSAAPVAVAATIGIPCLGLVGGGNGAEAEHGCRSEDAKLLHDSDLVADVKG